jgi:hypothetical protein
VSGPEALHLKPSLGQRRVPSAKVCTGDYDPTEWPVRCALETWAKDDWVSAQPGFGDMLAAVRSNSTAKHRVGPLGYHRWCPYPMLYGVRLPLPAYVEGRAVVLEDGGDSDGVPFAALINRDPDHRNVVSATFAMILGGHTPFMPAARALVDLNWSSDDGWLPIGDLYRAVHALPLAAEASAADTLAAEGRAVCIDGRLWLKSRCGTKLSTRATGSPPFASNGQNIERLRAAHARTAIERTQPAEDDGDVITTALTQQTVARGAFWALSAIELAIGERR